MIPDLIWNKKGVNMKLLKNCLLILGLSTASLTAENINLLENGGFEQENTA
jgi:hypothetical protein